MIIVDYLKYVNELVCVIKYWICIVILEGDIVNFGGFMIGGGVCKLKSILF